MPPRMQLQRYTELLDDEQGLRIWPGLQVICGMWRWCTRATLEDAIEPHLSAQHTACEGLRTLSAAFQSPSAVCVSLHLWLQRIPVNAVLCSVRLQSQLPCFSSRGRNAFWPAHTYLSPGLGEAKGATKVWELRKGLGRSLDTVMHGGSLCAYHALLDEDAAQPGHGLLPLIHVGPVLRLGESAMRAQRWSCWVLPGAPALPGRCPGLGCPLEGPPGHSGLRPVWRHFAGGLLLLLRSTAWTACTHATGPQLLIWSGNV